MYKDKALGIKHNQTFLSLQQEFSSEKSTFMYVA